MTKQEIIAVYRAASAANKRNLTSQALILLADWGILVDRRSLAYWRANEMPRSPLANRYRIAYASAIRSAATLQPAEQ
jgi:hypothetical protein